MDKLVKNLKKKFLADPLINLVEMNMPENGNIQNPSISSILEENVDSKYILKTIPVIKRIYEEAILKNPSAVAFKARKDFCNTCDKVLHFEVMKEDGKNWICKCLTCNTLKFVEIENFKIEKEEIVDEE